jgi:uncharacterized membrane protein
MIQNFLLQFIPAMEQGITLAVPLGILLAIFVRLEIPEYKKKFLKALYWGFWLSIFITAVKVGTRNAVSREIFEGIAMAVSIAAEWIVIFFLIRKGDALRQTYHHWIKSAACTLVIMFFFYHGMELWLIPVNIIIGSAGSMVSQLLFIKILGYILGLAFAFESAYVVYKAASALHYKRLIFVFVIQIVAVFIQQLIFIVQVLMARNILNTPALMKLMAPIINHSSWLIFIIFAALLFVPVTLYLQPHPTRPDNANPAQYRKILARAKAKKRWAHGTIIFLIGMVLLASVGNTYANKKEELVPAVPVRAAQGVIQIPLEQVEDGHLHRFVYTAGNDVKVRVIVIRKGGSAYGVGLDACEICGPTGYYEKDGQVICRLCDVMMNKATIGTPGGCNPIPVKYSINGGKITLQQSELESKRDVFR